MVGGIGRPRRLDITDRWWPYGHAAMLLGGFFAVLIVAALLGRLVERPLIDALAPLVDGDRTLGFAVGFASGVTPWAFAWWYLVGRHRRIRDEAPLGTPDEDHDASPDDAAPARVGTPTTLIVGVLYVLSSLPLLILGDWEKWSDEKSVDQRIVNERLPGAETGALTVMLGGGLLVLGSWVRSPSPRRRSDPDDGAQ